MPIDTPLIFNNLRRNTPPACNVLLQRVDSLMKRIVSKRKSREVEFSHASPQGRTADPECSCGFGTFPLMNIQNGPNARAFRVSK